ncbi:MAG: 4Fe-4S dicluster domain-containing protein, partial [Pseudomonadota bacterium]
APTLVRSFFEFNVSHTVLAFIIGLTSSTYLMAGFAREQVCTYMCPYARFQSAMFDENTLIIGYDEKRGEKRGKHKKNDSWEGRGHCIDCTACVQVCPVGIDIRDGLQMECIACGLCVDACNDVMDKIDLPRGLIRYDTTRHMVLKNHGIHEKFRIIRPRTIFYSVLILLVAATMLFALLTKNPVKLHVLHDRNPLFVTLSSGETRNGYEIKILNKDNYNHIYKLNVTGIDDLDVTIQSGGNTKPSTLSVAAGSVGHFRVFVKSNIKPQSSLPLLFKITAEDGKTQSQIESIFMTEGSSE